MADKTDDKEDEKATPAKADVSSKAAEPDPSDEDEDEDDEDDDEAEKPPAKTEANKPEPKKPEPAKKPEPKKAEAKKPEPAKKPVTAVKKPSTPKADKVKDTKRDEKKSEDKGVAPKAVHIGGESLIDRVLPHLKKIMVGSVILAVVLTGVFAVKWWRERKREKATQGIAIVLELANRPVIAKPDPKIAIPSFTSTKDRAAAVLAALDSEGVDLGPSFRAGFLLDNGQYDAAIAEYESCRSRDDIQGVLCREDLGIAQEAMALAGDASGKQAGFEKALETFKTMQPDDQGPRYAYALYHQGRLNITLTKFDDARALLEKAKALAANTDLATLINRRLETIPQ
jgi:hypothetical protein